MNEGNILMLMLTSMIMMVAIILSFMSSRWSCPVAYAAMICGDMSGWVHIEGSTYLFWAIATLICLGLDLMLPKEIARTRAGLYHICGGTLAGTAVGLCFNNSAGIICGAAAGAFFGALAFANTRAGRPMHFPSYKFFNYLGAKGLPAIVAMSMIGLVVVQLISPAQV